MRWILSNLPLLAFLFIVISMVRAVRRAQRLSQEHKADGGETDEQRRVREIQERIRRIAAQRRGHSMPAQPPPLAPMAEPAPSMRETMRRVLTELERPIERRIPILTEQDAKAAEVQRQEQLAEQLRALDVARRTAERRASSVAQAREVDAQSETAGRAVMRGALLADLKDPQSLRRAFLLREVFGTPVGLR
jgi:hypothetical protein